MQQRSCARLVAILWAPLAVCAVCTGCLTTPSQPADSQIARELEKGSLPAYVIEPPDILNIDALRVVPKPPYHIEPLDTLLIQVTGTPVDAPIDGLFAVDPDGTVNLGLDYGPVLVTGMTLEQAGKAIEAHLKKRGLTEPKAVVSLSQSRGTQLIRGEHLVRPDGTVSLGLYGSAYVTGMTIEEAKKAIETQLSRYLEQPEVSVDVLAYNSKVFYVIMDGGGYGQQMVRLPITGNDTVLDALSQISGLPIQASKHHIWVARPAPPNCEAGDQILPVDWNAITECGQTATNYQLFPGDRIYVKADSLIALDNAIAKIVSPIERIFGVTILGDLTILRLANSHPGRGTITTGGFGGLGGF